MLLDVLFTGVALFAIGQIAFDLAFRTKRNPYYLDNQFYKGLDIKPRVIKNTFHFYLGESNELVVDDYCIYHTKSSECRKLAVGQDLTIILSNSERIYIAKTAKNTHRVYNLTGSLLRYKETPEINMSRIISKTEYNNSDWRL